MRHADDKLIYFALACVGVCTCYVCVCESVCGDEAMERRRDTHSIVHNNEIKFKNKKQQQKGAT